MEVVGLTPSFWKNRRVLVTGHTGFKGGWLCRWLSYHGAQITGFSLEPPTDPNFYERAKVANCVAHVHGDIRDLELMARIVADARPEIVFHFAAQPLVRYSYGKPVETFESNVLGTVNLLEAARRTPSVLAVVNATTDKVYQNLETGVAFRESDPLGGHDPYSASKACAEIVTAGYRRSFFGEGPAVATVRAGNVLGGGDWGKDRLVPDLVRSFSAGRKPEIRNPEAIRPWQHVLDALNGYLLLAERLVESPGDFSGAWNIGPDGDGDKAVGWIVNAVANAWGVDGTWLADDLNNPHEAGYLRLDNSRARSLLGWRPKLDAARCVEWTVEWYLDNLSGGEMAAITHAQIERYEAIFR